MLTFSCARVASAKLVSTWSAARFVVVATLSVITWNAAYADGMALGGCVGTQGSLNCVVRWGTAGDPYVRLVPEPANEVERARSAERDHKWQQRCRPIITQDRYGVPRYRYTAPGCEFGIIE